MVASDRQAVSATLLYKCAATVDFNLYRTLSRVLCVAHFQIWKGHQYLLEACAILMKQREKCFFLDLIGGGPYRLDMEILANSLGIREWCRFFGVIKPSDMVKYYREAAVVVLPSVNEGLGLALVEASACGRPIIGVRGTGMEDVVVHGVNGFLVEPADPGSLAYAIDYFV